MGREERFATVDSTKQKVIAYIVVFFFLAIMLVFGLRSSTQTPLHEGDERRSITCKWCQGEGTIEGERCKYCLGAKKLKAIIPGPNHPVRIKGTAWDLGRFQDRAAAEKAAASVDYTKVHLRADENTVGGVKLIFQDGDSEVEMQTKISGRFRGFIKPGHYQVRIEAPGYAHQEFEYEVPKRTLPVWPPIPGVEIEDEEELTLEIYLEK